MQHQFWPPDSAAGGEHQAGPSPCGQFAKHAMGCGGIRPLPRAGQLAVAHLAVYFQARLPGGQLPFPFPA